MIEPARINADRLLRIGTMVFALLFLIGVPINEICLGLAVATCIAKEGLRAARLVRTGVDLCRTEPLISVFGSRMTAKSLLSPLALRLLTLMAVALALDGCTGICRWLLAAVLLACVAFDILRVTGTIVVTWSEPSPRSTRPSVLVHRTVRHRLAGVLVLGLLVTVVVTVVVLLIIAS